ncbi:MAG: hypothetical protein RR549_01385 [Oscillospiraceae bacterium]
MFKKSKLKKELKNQIKLIEELEKKRYRSQAKLVEAILIHESPSDEDVDYFNQFTERIESTRTRIHEIQAELDAL